MRYLIIDLDYKWYRDEVRQFNMDVHQLCRDEEAGLGVGINTAVIEALRLSHPLLTDRKLDVKRAPTVLWRALFTRLEAARKEFWRLEDQVRLEAQTDHHPYIKPAKG